jgi:LPS-assembly lipoprotein
MRLFALLSSFPRTRESGFPDRRLNALGLVARWIPALAGMTKSWVAAFPLLLLSASLAGCGLQPMYAGGGSGAIAQGLSQVEVSAIEGRAGWLVRNALVDRLDAAPGTGRYRLDIRLDDNLEGFALLSDDTISRERRTLRARYQLVDTASNEIVFDDTVGSDAGVDVLQSDYATIAAEQTALENLSKVIADRIVTNVSLRLREQGGDASGGSR